VGESGVDLTSNNDLAEILLNSHSIIIADGMANRVLIDTVYKIDYTPFEGISYYKVTDADDNKVANPDQIIACYTPKILKIFGDFQKFLH